MPTRSFSRRRQSRSRATGNPARYRPVHFERLEDRRLLVTDLVSVGLPEVIYGNNTSYAPSISHDGRYVAFASEADNLVPGDTNGVTDVFVFDRQTGITERVSVASDGSQAVGPFGDDGHSLNPSISADGRYVAFESGAMNLTDEPWFWDSQIYVHDRYTGVTDRVSVNDGGDAADRSAVDPAISADGRYVAFVSNARNLIAGDTNLVADVFVRDRRTGKTARVSVDSEGGQGNGSSFDVSISANGRHVAFASSATNLVPGDTNGVRDFFVHDQQTGITRRVNVDSEGNQANAFSQGWASLSPDGTLVAFMSAASNLVPNDTNNAWDVFVHDLNTGITERVSVNSSGVQANSDSHQPTLSADGRWVSFSSTASNLADDGIFQFFRADAFVHDRQTGTTRRVNLAVDGGAASDGVAYPVISGDGQFVAFESIANNLTVGDTNGAVDVFVRDLQAATTVAASTAARQQPANDGSSRPLISEGGRYVVFHSFADNLTAGDTSGSNIFARDMEAQTTTAVNVHTNGTRITAGTTPEISPDGRFIVFNGGNNLYLRDRETGITTWVAGSLGPFDRASVSADGRYVAYYTWSSHQVSGDTNIAEDIFLRDMLTETTRRISVSDLGIQANDASYNPKISADGRYVAFESEATNLVPGDTNGTSDIFVVDTTSNTIRRVSVASNGAQGNGISRAASISADGRYVAFHSSSSNLVPSDTNSNADVFVHDLQTGTTIRVSTNSAGNQGNFGSFAPSISADGSVVAFDSDATNLVAGDTNSVADVFVHYIATGATRRISTNNAGGQANGHSFDPAISPDGLYVAYRSIASNLADLPDQNGAYDIFRWHEQFDWSDAPAPYPTLAADSGARHGASGPYLGAARDAENDGTPDASAGGDEDDDGVAFAANLGVSSIFNRTGRVTVTSSAAGKLDAFIDFNQDGDWDDAGERVFKHLTIAAGDHELEFTIPAGARAGTTYARFRLSSAGVAGPEGVAYDGEVEDQQIFLLDQSHLNLDIPLDVNGDGGITSSDAVIVIDYLNLLVPDALGNIPLPVQPPNAPVDPLGGGEGLALFFDVNGDGFLTAADAVSVIDQLNLQNAADDGGGGEGEASAAVVTDWLPLAGLPRDTSPPASAAPGLAARNIPGAASGVVRLSAELLRHASEPLRHPLQLSDAPVDRDDGNIQDSALQAILLEWKESLRVKA